MSDLKILNNANANKSASGGGATNSGPLMEFDLSKGGSQYVAGNYTNVALTGGDGLGAEANITVTAGGLIQLLNNLEGGTGYTPETFKNEVPLTGGSGTGATADIETNIDGEVINVTLVAPGTGYIAGDVLSASTDDIGPGAGFSIVVFAASSVGVVTQVELTVFGGNYKVGNILSVNNASLGGTGSGLEIDVTLVGSTTTTPTQPTETDNVTIASTAFVKNVSNFGIQINPIGTVILSDTAKTIQEMNGVGDGTYILPSVENSGDFFNGKTFLFVNNLDGSLTIKNFANIDIIELTTGQRAYVILDDKENGDSADAPTVALAWKSVVIESSGGGGTYTFEALTFTTAAALSSPPNIQLSPPVPFQLDGTLYGNGLTVTTLDFTNSRTAVDLELVNAKASSATMNGTVIGNLSYPILEVAVTLDNLKASTATSIFIPNLKIVRNTFTVTSSTSLTNVNAPELIFIGSAMTFNNNTVLTTINLPAIEYIYGAITINSGSASITSLSLGSSLKAVTGNILITTATLDQASVDGILIALAALDGTGGTADYSTPRTITITGPSAAPSAASLAARTKLAGRGVTVTTN